MPCVHVVSRCFPHVRLELFDSLCNLILLYNIIGMLKDSFFTHYLTILYFIHMPCVLIINLYYTSKINIIH